MNTNNPVKLTEAEARAIEDLKSDGLGIQFHLIVHCRSFSSNGIRMKETWYGETAVLNHLPPIQLAQALLGNFETVAAAEVE